MIVRDIDCSSYATTGSVAQVYDNSLGQVWWFTGPVTQYSTSSWRGRQVFQAGNSCTFYSASAPWSVRLSGYLLDA